MKSKIVIWGSNAQDEKILIALALRAEESKVDVWTFPESVATEDFYQQMLDNWRDGDGFAFPEEHTRVEQELTVSGSLLPDGLKVERPDIIQRGQSEWHFLVLSEKLRRSYEAQLAELKERVEAVEIFDEKLWDTLKEFWVKLQEQVRERNLFKEHADALRDNANALFARMKQLRTQMDFKFENTSKEVYDAFMAAFAEVERKLAEGSRIAPLFDELKKQQEKFRRANMSRIHRAQVWDKLNATYKSLKDKRAGHRQEGGSGAGGPISTHQHIQNRYEGLMSAIEKMEQSMRRDRNDLDFQRHKIDTTTGQLEAEIRKAKLVMVEERLASKEVKLKEMKATQIELEKRLDSFKDRENRRAAQEVVKEKIAGEIRTRSEGKPRKEESFLSAAGATIGESLGDMMDTLKAAVSVASEKIADAYEEVKEEASEKLAEAREAVSEMKADAVEKAVAVKAALSEKRSDAQKTGSEVKSEASQKAAAVKAALSEKMEDAGEALAGMKTEAAEKAAAVKAALSEKMDDAGEAFAEMKTEAAEKAAAVKAALSEKMEDAGEALAGMKTEVAEKAAAVKAALSEKMEDAEEALAGMKTEAAEKAAAVKAALSEKMDDAGEALAEMKTEAAEKAAAVKAAISEKMDDAGEALAEMKTEATQKAAAVKAALSEKMDDAGEALAEMKTEAAQKAAAVKAVLSEKMDDAGEALAGMKTEAAEKAAAVKAAISEKMDDAGEVVSEMAANFKSFFSGEKEEPAEPEVLAEAETPVGEEK